MSSETSVAQWLGGPKDGDYQEIPSEAKFVVIPENKVNTMDPTLILMTSSVPVRDTGKKLILDYHARTLNE
jgi:hypothetical protein